jgi:hypothetical protein
MLSISIGSNNRIENLLRPDQRRLWNQKYDAHGNYTVKDDGQLYRQPTDAKRK